MLSPRSLLLILQLLGQPVQSLIQAITACCTRGLHVPCSTAHCMQTQLVSDLSCVHCIGKILDNRNDMIRTANGQPHIARPVQLDTLCTISVSSQNSSILRLQATDKMLSCMMNVKCFFCKWWKQETMANTVRESGFFVTTRPSDNLEASLQNHYGSHIRMFQLVALQQKHRKCVTRY